jgi:rod shape-determining protein MreB
MKDGVIANFEVAEKMLRHFLRLVIDRTLFKVKPTVIVCVPSGITEVERRAVRDSARSAGVKRLLMVAEPMAAAIGVGLPVETPVGSMVIDIGGGTTNIAVIALGGIVCDASIRTGGDELDQAIVQFMRKNYSLLIGEPTAERIKIRLGSAVPLEPEEEMDVKGRDLVSGLPKTVRVDSSGVRDAIQEPVSRIVNAVRRALEMTPPELASDILERGIVLTGGGSLIRGLDQLLIDETGLPVRMDDDPLTSVVRGTGRILDDYTRYGNVDLTIPGRPGNPAPYAGSRAMDRGCRRSPWGQGHSATHRCLPQLALAADRRALRHRHSMGVEQGVAQLSQDRSDPLPLYASGSSGGAAPAPIPAASLIPGGPAARCLFLVTSAR